MRQKYLGLLDATWPKRKPITALPSKAQGELKYWENISEVNTSSRLVVHPMHIVPPDLY